MPVALFPRCSFDLQLEGGGLVAGATTRGRLVIEAPEPIPRAEQIQLVFRSKAWAAYSTGKSSYRKRASMLELPLHLDVTTGPLAAGAHTFPFALEVPAWLPPALRLDDAAIEHEVEARVSVDWAVDPVARFEPAVILSPRLGTRIPTTVRSPPDLHESLAFEVTLASVVIVSGEPIRGRLALRGGHDARFEAIDLAVASVATVVMGGGDLRTRDVWSFRIPAKELRGGATVPFELPTTGVPPTFDNAFIRHGVALQVSVDVPWSLNDPGCRIGLDVLPAGSSIEGEAAMPHALGSERLQRIAAAVAEETGLQEGVAPVLVHGDVGPVRVSVRDAPRGGRMGLDVELTFPDVELGLELRPLGWLDGFRDSPLLPPPLADRYLLRREVEHPSPGIDDRAAAPFVEAALTGIPAGADVRFGDHHLAIRAPMRDDSPSEVIAGAQRALHRARAIGKAIAALPFPTPAAQARSAWEDVAVEQSAALVPTGPALYGLRLRARVQSGEPRAATASIRTVWTSEGPKTRALVDLSEVVIPRAARHELARDEPGERVRAVRAVFPTADVRPDGALATLERAGFTPDPRTLLPALEALFAWALDARGERRVAAPYR